MAVNTIFQPHHRLECQELDLDWMTITWMGSHVADQLSAAMAWVIIIVCNDNHTAQTEHYQPPVCVLQNSKFLPIQL